jgi:calcium-dependent protein kinase
MSKKIKGKKYTFLEEIGSGSYGKVYKVRGEDGKLYAIKKIVKDRSEQVVWKENKKISECELLTELKSKYLSPVIAYSTHKNFYYCVTPLYEKGDMRQYFMSKGGRLSDRQAFSVFKQLLSALSYLHRKNITHNDIKLENIFVKSKIIPEIVLGDFGNASYNEESKKKILTTLEYSMPEQCRFKKISLVEHDIWSSLIVYYILLIGNYPYALTSATPCESYISLPGQFKDDSITYLKQKCHGTEKEEYLGDESKEDLISVELCGPAVDFFSLAFSIDKKTRLSSIKKIRKQPYYKEMNKGSSV